MILKIVIRIFCMFMLSISITACSNNKNSSKQDNGSTASIEESSDMNTLTTNEVADTTNSISSCIDSDKKNINIHTQTQTKSNNNNNSPLEAYKEVLQNKVEFFSTDNKKSLYLNDFLTNEEIYGTIFKIKNFSVLDMDGDKIPEVVLGLTPGNPPEFYEVLHYMNGKVYGYIQVLRGLRDLKADGTFSWSCGAMYNGYGKMRFESTTCKTDYLGYRKPGDNNDWSNLSYSINNKPVTKESYISFENEQDQKKDVAWYEFSQDNIEKKLNK